MSCRRLFGLLVLALVGVASSAAAGPGSGTTAGPSDCGAPQACAAACRDGAGDRAACTVLADALLRGAGIEPDRPRALALFTTACGMGADDDSDQPVDVDACVALGDLRRDGWMFEVERSDDARDA